MDEAASIEFAMGQMNSLAPRKNLLPLQYRARAAPGTSQTDQVIPA
jgi:hypothetical protein